MEASKTQSTKFLDLAPTHHSPPASPSNTKAIPAAIANDKAPQTSSIIEPLQTDRRDSTQSSDSGDFLRLGHADDVVEEET